MRCSSSRHWSIQVHQDEALQMLGASSVLGERPYLNQLLFVISHKSPGAEIRNEEASCTEIAGLRLLQSCFFFYNEHLIACNPVKNAPFPAKPIGSPKLSPLCTASFEIKGLQADLQEPEQRKCYPVCTKSIWGAVFAQPSLV